MTLTFKTAKHAIDKYGKIYDIGDEEDILDDYSMARDEAEEINEHNPDFKPCIVVTTAREALEAAWDAAHPVPERVTTIPPGTPIITRGPKGIITTAEGYDFPIEASADGETELRTLTPLPEPEPEPWEESRFCYANGHIYERVCGKGTAYWMRPGSEIRYYRDYLVELNPKPIDFE